MCDGGRVPTQPYKVYSAAAGVFYARRRAPCRRALLVYGAPGNSVSARQPVADRAAQELVTAQIVKSSPSTLF